MRRVLAVAGMVLAAGCGAVPADAGGTLEGTYRGEGTQAEPGGTAAPVTWTLRVGPLAPGRPLLAQLFPDGVDLGGQPGCNLPVEATAPGEAGLDTARVNTALGAPNCARMILVPQCTLDTVRVAVTPAGRATLAASATCAGGATMRTTFAGARF